MSEKKKQISLIITIVMFGLADSLPNAMAPVITDFGRIYPDVDPSLLSQVVSVPTIFFVFAALLASACVKRLGYYRTSLLALGLVLIGGLAPIVILNFTLVLVLRALFGAGIGILLTISKTVVVLLFEGDLQARLMGYDNTLGVILISVLQVTAGYIAVNNVALSYIIHIFAIIPLVLIIKNRQQFKTLDQKTETSKEKKDVDLDLTSKDKIPLEAIFLIVIMVLRSIPTQTVIYQVSALVYELELGNSATAGWISTGMSIGSIVSGLAFVYVYRVFKEHTALWGLLIEAMGHIAYSFSKTAFLLAASMVIIVIGMIMYVTGITMDINKITPRSRIELAMGMLTALPYLSGFISPYYSILITKLWPNGGVHGQLVVGAALEIVLFVLLIVYFQKKKAAKQ